MKILWFGKFWGLFLTPKREWYEETDILLRLILHEANNLRQTDSTGDFSVNIFIFAMVIA